MLAGFHSPFFLDDINYSYTPDDYSPMKTLHISTFDGKDWQISEKPGHGVSGHSQSPSSPLLREAAGGEEI